MKSLWLVGMMAAVPTLSAVARADEPVPLPVIQDLNLEKLWGKYYEIGTYLQWIEDGCTNSAISFAPGDQENTAKLTIECDRGWFHPKINGTAIPIESDALARSTATFHPPVGDEYKEEFDIIMVDDEYDWLVIGHPKRHLLFVLSRNAKMPTDQLIDILERLDSNFGYTNVRKNLTCTEHRNVPASLCRDALWERAWFDDLIRYN